MTNYINPHLSDKDYVRQHGVLSRRQADLDAEARRAKPASFDAALFRKPHNPGKLPAWAKHPPRCRCWDCCTCPACRERRANSED